MQANEINFSSGPSVFKVQGEVYRFMGPLRQEDGQQPKCLQTFFVDAAMQADIGVSRFGSSAIAARAPNFRPGFRPGPRWGSLQHSPRRPSWFKGDLLLRGRGGKRMGETGREGERRGRGGKEKGRGGEGMAPLTQIPGSAPGQ